MKTNMRLHFEKALALILVMIMSLTSVASAENRYQLDVGSSMNYTSTESTKETARTPTCTEKLTDIDPGDESYHSIDYVLSNSIMDGTSATTFSPNLRIVRKDLVEALYNMDGSPSMTGKSDYSDVAPDSEYEEAISWGQAYGITQGTSDSTFSPEATVSREQVAAMMYRFAGHNDVECDSDDVLDTLNDVDLISDYANSAVNWVVSEGIMDVTDNSFRPDAPISRSELADILTNYAETPLEYVGVEENGLTLLYPSEEQRTICPLRDFYVVGDIEDGITVPSDAKLTVSVSTKDGTLMREVYTNIKDNQEGMFVDYPEITITGDREAFRASMMPDLVYDPAHPESFKDTWNKAYYTDEHYTCVVYGGSYHQDINPVDQFGQELKPLAEGDYQLSVQLESNNSTLASLHTQITIGVDSNKVLARFSPTIHMEKVKAYASAHDYTIYLDPFPGYWDTATAMPDWGINYNGQIRKRWALADRECYIGGTTHFFDYNITPTSTSYSVEIGQLAYDKVLNDSNSISYCYYDIGEPVIEQHGKTYQGNLVTPAWNHMNSLVFTRVDKSTSPVEENYLDSQILDEATSIFDLQKIFIANLGDTVSLNGVCKVIQPERVTFNPDTESYTLGNRIASITYTIKTAAGAVFRVVDKEIPGLTRKFDDGWVNTSVLEYRHDFTIDESMKGNTYVILAQPKDEFGNDVGGLLFACSFEVPR